MRILDKYFDMKHEKLLLNLLNLQIFSLKDNIFLIFDKNTNLVGYIKKKENLDAKNQVTYQTYIETDDIYYQNTRNLNKKLDNFYYKIYLKNNKMIEHIIISLNYTRQLTLYYHEKKEKTLFLNPNALYLIENYKENDNIIEKIIFYTLTPKFIDNKESLTYYQYIKKETNTFENTKKSYTFEASKKNFENDLVTIKKIKYFNGKIVDTEIFYSDDSLDKVIRNHQLGINDFFFFKESVKENLPFINNIFSYLLKGFEEKDDILSLFLPIDNKPKKLVKKYFN